MHELALSQSIVEMISERALQESARARVTRVVLEIGKVSGILPAAIAFSFESCAQGTPAEGAVLEIVEPPGLARCHDCQKNLSFDRPYGFCDCGNSNLEWLAGTELQVKGIEITETEIS